jgi:hypothetical protein
MKRLFSLAMLVLALSILTHTTAATPQSSRANTCKIGFFPRAAYPGDRVCVRPKVISKPRRPPIGEIAPDGGPLGRGSGIIGCRLSGALCPPRMQASFEDDSVGCVCRRQ